MELQHHGVKGQKWGVRKYQNPDGSLTPAGQKRQAKLDQKQEKKELKADVKAYRKLRNETNNKFAKESFNSDDKVEKYLNSAKNAKGKDHVDKVFAASDKKIRKRNKAATRLGIASGITGALVAGGIGMAFIYSKLYSKFGDLY